MKKGLARLTGLTSSERADVLHWLARQAEEIRVEVMMGRFHNFHNLQKQSDLQAPLLDYCALILSCKRNGWEAERRYHSSASLAAREISGMSRRRVARAKDTLRATADERLAVHWGKVVELKREGLGFRRIAEFLRTELRLNVSHTTIWKLWREWENEG